MAGNQLSRRPHWLAFNCETTFADDSVSKGMLNLLSFFKCLFIFERERESKGAAERRGQRIRGGLCTDSREPDAGLELTNHEMAT